MSDEWTKIIFVSFSMLAYVGGKFGKQADDTDLRCQKMSDLLNVAMNYGFIN